METQGHLCQRWSGLCTGRTKICTPSKTVLTTREYVHNNNNIGPCFGEDVAIFLHVDAAQRDDVCVC